MTWEAAKKEVDGYQGAVYHGFKNIKDAEYFTVHGTVSLSLNVEKSQRESPRTAPPPHPGSPATSVNHMPLPVKMVSFSKASSSSSTPSHLSSTSTPLTHSSSTPLTLTPSSLNPLSSQLSSLLSKYKKHIDYRPSKPIVHIYTDGSTIGNGRKNATGGYGVFIPVTSYVKERLITRELVNGKITNGVAELKAMMRALEEILLIDIEVDEDIELEFIIHYDSTYAADVVTGKKSAKANLELVQSCRGLLAECTERVSVEFQHVYSHTGKQDIHSIGNEIADKLAGGVF